MSLSLKESRAISGLSDILYDFLPGSGWEMWNGHVNFETGAAAVGVQSFWLGEQKDCY
jgi:hypothetical protein